MQTDSVEEVGEVEPQLRSAPGRHRWPTGGALLAGTTPQRDLSRPRAARSCPPGSAPRPPRAAHDRRRSSAPASTRSRLSSRSPSRNATRASPSSVHAMSTGARAAPLHVGRRLLQVVARSREVRRVELELEPPDLAAQSREVAGVLAFAHQCERPLGERHGRRDVAAPGLHDAGVPVGRGTGLGRSERLGARDGLAAEAYGVGGVTALEVGGRHGDRELHGLVAGVRARRPRSAP